VQRSEGGNIGVVPCRDIDGMTYGEAGHVAFGLEIPQGLVRLAQIRKTQVERFTLIIGNTMALRPGTDLQAQLTNTCGDLARLKIDPKVIAGVMDPGLGR